jgi:nucleoside-diphosphate-sugar epimerase
MVVNTALITGIDGFTGCYVAAEMIAAGYKVYGLGKKSIAGVEASYDVDMMNFEGLSQVINDVRPTVVINLAAVAFVNHGDVGEIYSVNIVGCRNLLQALHENNIKPEKVLLISSANVYGNSDIGVLDESISPSPQNDYAISKYSMELMAKLWLDKLPIIIVRPFNYTGVGQNEKFLVPKIVSHFVQGKDTIELGNIDVYRDFSDVRFVAKTYVNLLQSDTASIVCNVCTGVGYSLKEILSAMSVIAGYTININVNPSFIRSNEVHKLVGNPDQRKRLTAVSSIPLEQTLQWMFDSDQFR